MTDAPGTLSFAVLAVCGRGWSVDEREGFVDGVTGLLAAVESRFRVEHPPLRLVPRVVASDTPQSLTETATALALIEVSAPDEGLAYLVGRLIGVGIPCLFICRNGVQAPIASLGLDDSRVHRYGSAREDLPGHEVLQQEVRDAVSTSRILAEMVYTLWFPRATKSVWVVCPQVHEPSEFADRSNPDYTYLDNLGDTDALLELMVFLSRHYPGATIGHFSAADLPPGHTSGDLVIIGGPGDVAEISNQTCKIMMREVGSRVSYSEDCQRMIVAAGEGKNVEHQAEIEPEAEAPGNRSRFSVRRDCGYFARFPNPLNESTAVVLVNGIHTSGVVGAGKAFADRREALRNYHAVFASGVDPKKFECHFGVRVLNGVPQVPEVQKADIYAIGPVPVAATAVSGAPSLVSTVSPGSVTVVFVAGDRGGSRVSQVQIPREIDAIQGALRACKFRDSFTFAVPILAASAQKVAIANRHNPTVMHFAGHGDDRSLSFIADEGVLVDAMVVSGEQLGAILRAFPHRVRLCVLNTCGSAPIAEELATSDVVDAAIGWPGQVSDSTAIALSEALYTHLGEGLGLARSVELATASGEGNGRPQLFLAKGVDGTGPIVQGAHES